MVGETGSHSRGSGQRVMESGEIVEYTHPEHLVFETLSGAGEIASATDEGRHTGAKGGIEAFNIGGVDGARQELRHANQGIDWLPGPVNQAAGDLGESAALSGLDHLDDMEIRPRNVGGTSW